MKKRLPLIITIYLPSKTNGALLNFAARTNKLVDVKYIQKVLKVKSDAETNANAKHLSVSRTDSLCFCCIVFYFAILQLVVKFVKLF